ncbi:hepatic leukemia factor-like [Panonychus citri]|uniref:hepatic leukemia factor-like n=1 Tax=Panonychus citri TaxID=50023 RepID=UPI0023078771|nr:hepatic leukemia factor-like [Panonychus citri]
MFSSSSSYSSPTFYPPPTSMPSHDMMSSMYSLAQVASMYSSSPSYSKPIEPEYSESPLELTSYSSKSRRKKSNPRRISDLQQSPSPSKSFNNQPPQFPQQQLNVTPVKVNMEQQNVPMENSPQFMADQPLPLKSIPAQSMMLQNVALSLLALSSTPDTSDTSSQEIQVSESENNPPAKKKKANPVPDELKNDEYWARRKRIMNQLGKVVRRKKLRPNGLRKRSSSCKKI